MTGSVGLAGRFFRAGPLAVAAGFLLGALLLRPEAGSAIEMEIVTYNGFSALSTAFEKIQIIFADGRYLGLIGVMAVCGVVLAGMAAGVKAFRDGQLSIVGTMIPLFAGVVVTVAFILPRQENAVIVYDRVLNRQARFDHLPTALVLVAGLLNRIETGLVEIIEDSGIEPDPYGEGAGGIRFNLLRRLTEARQVLPDKSMERTLKEYAKNCVYDLLNSYGALVTWDDLLYSEDLVDVFEQGAVNFKMTTVYTDELSSQESCQSAWAVVRPYVTNLTNFQGSLERVCTGDGFEWASAQERQVCLENLLETVAYYGGADYGEAAFLGQQTAMARILYEGLQDVEDVDRVFQARVSQQAMTGGIGAFSTANDWFPIIRAVMCAVVISMVPFVFLFVATPLFGRALAVFFGLFSFVTVWGVVEVLMHSLAADYVFNMLGSFRQDGFGFASIMSYPDACTKALGVFGLVRSSGMVLATLVTGIFVKVGTYELTQISGSIGGTIRERAERSAAETLTPLGRAELARGLATSSGEMSLLEQATWQERARAVVTESVFGYGSLLGRTETERQAARDLGLDGDVRRLGGFSGQNAAAGDMGQLGAVEDHFGEIPSVGDSMRLYENLGTYDLGRRVGDVHALESTVAAIKKDPAMKRLFGDSVTGYDVQRMTAVADSLRRAGAFAGQSELLHMTAGDWGDEKKVAEALDLNAAGASGELAWWMANGRSLMELGGRLNMDPVAFATSLRMLATGQEYFGQLRQEAAESILEHGTLSPAVQKKIAAAQSLPWGKALAASGFTIQGNLNPEQARSAGKFLAASGLGWVNPEWLEGGVSMHLAPNRDGSARAVSVKTEQGFWGEEGSHFVKKEALSAPEASAMTGKDMPAGDYQRIYTQGGQLVALSGQGGMHVVTKGLIEDQRALSASQASELVARDYPGYRGQVIMPGGSYRILRDPGTNDIVSASGEAGVFFVGKNGVDLFRYTKDGAVHEQIDPATGEIANRSQASNVLGMDTGAVRQAIVERRISDYLKEMVDRAKLAGTPEDFLHVRRAQDELAGGISAVLGVFERVSDTKNFGGGGSVSLSLPGWRLGAQGTSRADGNGMSHSPGQGSGSAANKGRPLGFSLSASGGLHRYYQQDWIAQDVAAKISDHVQWLTTGGKAGSDTERFNKDMYELYREYGTDYRGDELLDVLEDTSKTEELLVGNGRKKVSGSAGEVARLFAGSRLGTVDSAGR